MVFLLVKLVGLSFITSIQFKQMPANHKIATKI